MTSELERSGPVIHQVLQLQPCNPFYYLYLQGLTSPSWRKSYRPCHVCLSFSLTYVPSWDTRDGSKRDVSGDRKWDTPVSRYIRFLSLTTIVPSPFLPTHLHSYSRVAPFICYGECVGKGNEVSDGRAIDVTVPYTHSPRHASCLRVTNEGWKHQKED